MPSCFQSVELCTIFIETGYESVISNFRFVVSYGFGLMDAVVMTNMRFINENTNIFN